MKKEPILAVIYGNSILFNEIWLKRNRCRRTKENLSLKHEDHTEILCLQWTLFFRLVGDVSFWDGVCRRSRSRLSDGKTISIARCDFASMCWFCVSVCVCVCEKRLLTGLCTTPNQLNTIQNCICENACVLQAVCAIRLICGSRVYTYRTYM